MTAAEIIHGAAVFCGLAEDPEPAVPPAETPAAETPAAVEAVGLASLNRWLGRLWDAAPNASLRAAVWTEEVAAGQEDVVLPAGVDVICKLLLDGEPVPPLAPGVDGWGFHPLADTANTEGALCRRVRLVPAAGAAGTLEVYGFSRFVALDLDEATGCDRLDTLLFYYVAADLFLHIRDFDARKAALAAALECKREWLESAEGRPEVDLVHVPERSFHEG